MAKQQTAVQTLQTNQQINPFAVDNQRQHINAGTVAIEEQRAIAEAQGKLIIAKRFPRDPAAAYERLMISCKRLSLAEKAMYSYPRGKDENQKAVMVTGPSIRLAEELARAWGNLDYGIRELSQRDGESEMEAFCWDLETNVMSSQKFTVKHERHTRSGKYTLTDPRDIYELTANQAGRRLRSRILAILPPDLVEHAVNECYATVAGSNGEPLVDRVRKMQKAFEPFGVTKQHIEERLGKQLNSILIDEFVELQSIYTSLRDGVSKPSDWFGMPEASDNDAVNKVNAAIAGAPSAPAPVPAPVQQAAPVQPVPVQQAPAPEQTPAPVETEPKDGELI